MSESFVEQCLNGGATLDEIDDFVDAWHNGAGAGATLSDYLGFSDSEYNLWVQNPNSLRLIIFLRNNELSLTPDVGQGDVELSIAARGLTHSADLQEVVHWLRSTGRLK